MRVFLLLAIIPLCGATCAKAPSYAYADCHISRLPDVNVLTCSDDSVGIHCKRMAGKAYHPRACHVPGKWSAFKQDYRKSNIIIGKSYTGCTGHEFAHHFYPDKPEWVDAQYPCVGDKRSK